MEENQPILIKRIAYPAESFSHNNNKMPKRNQKDPPASRDPDFEGNFKFINRENRLFASRVYSASCHGQLCTFSTGKTLKCQLKRWSRTFRRYQQQKQHEFREVSQLIPWVKPVFSAVFLTLLHDRVAEMPRKMVGKTSLRTWQAHLGVYHSMLRRALLPPGCTSLNCVAAFISMVQKCTSHVAACRMLFLVDTNTQALHSGSFEDVCSYAPYFQAVQKKWGPWLYLV